MVDFLEEEDEEERHDKEEEEEERWREEEEEVCEFMVYVVNVYCVKHTTETYDKFIFYF